MIFGSESNVYFQMRCRLNLFLPYGPMLMKAKKKTVKNKKIEFRKANKQKNGLGILWI